MNLSTVLKQPSGFLPVAMSLAALAVVGVTIGMNGVVHEADEGTAAHLWQLLMAGQLPIIGFFALRWLPTAPKQGAGILIMQIVAALAAAVPVWWFQF